MSAHPPVSSMLEMRYADALDAYVRAADEEALLRAYELGRQIMDSGGGVLDLSAAHQAAFEALMRTPSAEHRGQQAMQRSYEFLAESLAPFEMAQRGFREANHRLLSANEQLAKQTAELAAANDELASSNRAMDRERAKLAAVIASINDGLVVADGDGAINAANERSAELLGRPATELIGTDINAVAELLTGRCGEQPGLRDLRSHLRARTATPATFELRTTAPAGDLQVQLFAVRVTPGPGIGVMLRDVTAERELSRAKDELVAVVSHELRNPLSNIIGFSELLEQESTIEPAGARYLEIIIDESRRLAALVDDFLDLRRIDRGAATIRQREIDLQPLLLRLSEMIKDGDPHVLRFDVPAELPTVSADPERLWQVLLNLFSNARKYAPEGGEIAISARPSVGEVEVRIADQGLGIPPEALPHLFGEFYRVQTSDRRTIAGTGLGLSICWKIIRAHGGEIWAESGGLGHGARFHFTIPTVG